jgi:anti-sigma factor RsiW
MTRDHDNLPPAPEALLAGYVDGELTAAERAAVEARLAHDPAAAAEVEAQRQVLRLWPTVPPPEPSPLTWVRTLTGITAGLAVAATVPTAAVRAVKLSVRRPVWFRAALRWTGAAAAVLFVLVLNPMASHEPAPVPSAEPFPVATPDDVDIVTLNAADADRLVVGNVPVRGPLDLAAPGDVVVVSIQPDVDGMLPYLRIHAESPSPMIVAPLDPADNPAP